MNKAALTPLLFYSLRLYCVAYLFSFTSSKNALAGLNAGTLWAGILIVVFFEILRAVFSARCFMIKLPKPRKKTSFPAIRDSFTLSMNASTTVITTPFSIPLCREI